MRIEVVGRNIAVTDAMREYCTAKAGKLPKFLDGSVQAITFTLTKDDHHAHGQFGAELIIDVQHHTDFVAHHHDKDLYAAIDMVTEKGERQLRDHKEQRQQGHR